MQSRLLSFLSAIFVHTKRETPPVTDIKINKERQKKYSRALQYTQAAVAHADLRYLKHIEQVKCVASGDTFSVAQMSACSGPVAYPVGKVTGLGYSDVLLWVGFEPTGQPGDVYRYHAWAMRGNDEVVPGWSLQLQNGVSDQRAFTRLLKQALQPA